ncbi:MAG TPA: D-alanyl-D-alanine carboxypeptidase/D-alanyl-D-alanine-endopeptidase, partial [Acidimicrobiia bacterium]|nr:D-alanyl-D-alanine carboxypeptidase/D-alanyl-D-alanine-endopeptidase [Acidimicrobiia bacterium]
AAPDPALLTGQRLRDALAARGVTITGAIRRGVAPADAREIAHVDSPPLSNIVGEMLRGSDNYTAEELLRDIAAGTSGGNGATTYAGTQIVAATLSRLGVPTDGLDLHDGSGLAPDDRVGCPTLLGVINRSTAAPLTAIDAGLPVAGRSGTLAEAFGGTPLAGRLRAKTGSIDGVVGLTGVVDGSVRPTFAFLANGRLSESTGVALQAAIAAAVAAYPDTRQPQLVVPRP